jgi:hypothetical protein
MQNRRLQLVRQRKPQKDDLSFMPPYSEQAKYLELADTFLSGDSNTQGDHMRETVVNINENRATGPPSKAA